MCNILKYFYNRGSSDKNKLPQNWLTVSEQVFNFIPGQSIVFRHGVDKDCLLAVFTVGKKGAIVRNRVPVRLEMKIRPES